MRIATFFLLFGALSLNSTTALGDHGCGAECSSVPDVITLTPDGSFGFTLNVAGDLGPINGAMVHVQFASGAAPEAEGLVAWAVGQDHPVLVGVTDAMGDVTFLVAGGGCIDPARYQGANQRPVRVTADGILLAEVAINSPDVVNSQGQLPTDTNASRPQGGNNCENGSTEVGLSDAVFHTVPFSLGTLELCSNFTGPDFEDPVGLADAVIATPYVKNGTSATCQ